MNPAVISIAALTHHIKLFVRMLKTRQDLQIHIRKIPVFDIMAMILSVIIISTEKGIVVHVLLEHVPEFLIWNF